MSRAVVCSASWLGSLRGHAAVGEGHAVGGAIGLALIAVLVVDCVVLRLAALDLVIRNKENTYALSIQQLFAFTFFTTTIAVAYTNYLGMQLKVICIIH